MIVFFLSHASNTFASSKLHFEKCLLVCETPEFCLKAQSYYISWCKLSTNPDTVTKLSIEEISSLVNEFAVDEVVFSAWKKVDITFRKETKEVAKKDQNYYN